VGGFSGGTGFVFCCFCLGLGLPGLSWGGGVGVLLVLGGGCGLLGWAFICGAVSFLVIVSFRGGFVWFLFAGSGVYFASYPGFLGRGWFLFLFGLGCRGFLLVGPFWVFGAGPVGFEGKGGGLFSFPFGGGFM